jgi:hypothetical protein
MAAEAEWAATVAAAVRTVEAHTVVEARMAALPLVAGIRVRAAGFPAAVLAECIWAVRQCQAR